jgi:hypothetical protein
VTDVTLALSTSTTIDQLLAAYRQQQKLTDASKIRLFYSGREMMGKFYLGNYALKDGEVVQAMIIGG